METRTVIVMYCVYRVDNFSTHAVSYHVCCGQDPVGWAVELGGERARHDVTWTVDTYGMYWIYIYMISLNMIYFPIIFGM